MSVNCVVQIGENGLTVSQRCYKAFKYVKPNLSTFQYARDRRNHLSESLLPGCLWYVFDQSKKGRAHSISTEYNFENSAQTHDITHDIKACTSDSFMTVPGGKYRSSLLAMVESKRPLKGNIHCTGDRWFEQKCSLLV